MTYILKLFFLLCIAASATSECLGQFNPSAMAHVGNLHCGPVSKGQFVIQQGVSASTKVNPQHWEPIVVDSFEVMALRDTSVLFVYRNKGGLFEANLQSQLKQLQVHDRILIFNITTKDVQGRKRYVSPLEYNLQ